MRIARLFPAHVAIAQKPGEGSTVMMHLYSWDRSLIARLGSQSGVCAASIIALLSAMPAASAAVINVIDVIPVGASAETGQNSEPSIAVDPLNPMNMVSGAFSSTLAGNDLSSPFWMSTNGGTTWSGFGSLPSSDKTIAWRQDGVAALAATLNIVNPGSTTVPPTGTVSTFQGGATNFGAAINTTPVQTLPDQPWLRTGPGGQTYLALNR